MGPATDPVISDSALPSSADVVVIGGGIIGTSAAFDLARRGVRVVLCEKGQIAGEQSSRNWGWVRKQGRDSRELPLIVESLRLWQGMNEAVGADTGFRTTGILYALSSDADIARWEAWLERVRPYQLDSRLVSGDELTRLMPGATRGFKAGLFTASDGRAEPQQAAPAIARAAQRAGATVLTGCAVRGLETTGGRVSGVVTERGHIACNGVVLATGAWSRLFCKDHDIRLPQLRVRSSVLRTGPVEGGPEAAAWLPDVAYRKRLDGGYTVAGAVASVADILPDSFVFFREFLPALRQNWRKMPLRFGRRFFEELSWAGPTPLDQASRYERVRVLDPAPQQQVNAGALAALATVYPVFAKAKVAQQWAGLIDVTPDVVPVISPVERLPGLVVATGFSGHGFGIGPGAGRLAADLVTGAPPVVDPHPFRLTRFSDGSEIRIEAGI
ncbi:FAD-binding oxidoreductase [Rhodovastum atsumiense]|uniref:FAD-binding oxidoreductase n=1 Tax=Rhodovastum atsumiense TaxID=504468 RepID=A0A5M6J0D2_9PROT|nr:FAD-binding oxidoreductase [Rhodovastum atsumiense]KAA5614052.1 FAD-binding oxidoreductase [Rhodovastum atsumiense]CAH2598866.1 FAD-binding oxidoreductase [Rhodovastum atsumiense]